MVGNFGFIAVALVLLKTKFSSKTPKTMANQH